MRGRKPVPSNLNELRGNPGKRPRNESEPRPAPALPECPPHLNEQAKAEWTRVSLELAALGLLTNLDRAALAGYCVSWARWVEAEAKVAEFGAVLVSPEGAFYQSPYLAVGNRAMADMQRFGSLFGFDPSSRTRLHAPAPKGKQASGKARFFSCN